MPNRCCRWSTRTLERRSFSSSGPNGRKSTVLLPAGSRKKLSLNLPFASVVRWTNSAVALAVSLSFSASSLSCGLYSRASVERGA